MEDKGRGWDPETARAWQRIGRDAAATAVGVFMLIWQTVFVEAPNAVVIGAALVALGLPPALRIDEKIRSKASE